MEPDFSGYITRYGLKCTDGRTIAHGAFATQVGEGYKIPLVYQHNHEDISQVLGHVIASKRDDGIWGDAFLNTSSKAQDARLAVQHGDLDKFSIWAKDLDERPDYQTREVLVHDGVLQEASLVLAGANAGAVITSVMAHSVNGVRLDPDEDLLVVSGEIQHADGGEPKEEPQDAPPQEPAEPKEEEPKDAPPAEGDKTQGEVLDSLTDEQRLAVNQFIEDLVPELVTEALAEEPQLTHSDSSTKGTTKMTRNLFDGSTKEGGATATLPQLKHDDVKSLLTLAKGAAETGGTGVSSLRDLVRSQKGKELLHADDYGVQNHEILFPDAQSLMRTPTFVDRRQEWVKTFMSGTSHSPFSRVKTLYADITADEARARGYLKGNRKVEEVFPIFKRTTGPAWIYKKQKLDRQDIIDIKDFDVVAWMKVEMRGKLDEEIARAGLFGDGRPVMVDGELNPDKILEPTGASGDGIRSVMNDDDLYSTSYYVPLEADATGSAWNVLLDTVTEAQEFYMGSGNKTAFVSFRVATKLLTIRDDFGHRIYRNLSEVAGDMDVSSIVRVPSELMPDGVLAIVLDLKDYNFGTDRGGEITLFDDFDIDFNQYKYLMETYLSGALVLPYSAQIFRQVDPSENTAVTELTAPARADNTVTVPTQTGVTWKRTDTGATVAGGSTITLDDTTLKQVSLEAEPASGYYFPTDADVKDTFTFRYKA